MPTRVLGEDTEVETRYPRSHPGRISGFLLNDIGRIHSGSIVVAERKKWWCTGSSYYSPEAGQAVLQAVNLSGQTRYLPLSIVDNKFPEVGWYNTTTDRTMAVYLDRKASHQWRWGFHSNVASFHYPYCRGRSSTQSEYLGAIFTRYIKERITLPSNWIHNTPNSLYSSLSLTHDWSYPEALNLLRAGVSASIAITPTMAISHSPLTPGEIGVFIGRTKVAEVQDNNNLTVLQPWAEDTLKEVCHA